MRRWRRSLKIDDGDILIKVDGKDADTKKVYSVCIVFYREDDDIIYFVGAQIED